MTDKNENNRRESEVRNNNSGSNRMPLSAKELKERISLSGVLKGDGIKVSRSGTIMECCCPLPDHQDSTPSFKIYEDQRYKCYGCDEHGDVIKYVRLRDNCDFQAACDWLEENQAKFPRFGTYASDQRERGTPTAPKELTEVEKLRCKDAADELFNCPPAWGSVAEERGWEHETIGDLAKAGDLGLHGDQLAFIYEGGMKVRDWPGRDFRWNCGSPSLWRGARIDEKSVPFVCEGETDAVCAIDAELECQGLNVVALPSASTIRPEWFEHWKDLPVILCLDNDDAGRKATEKMIEVLKGITNDIRIVSFDGDPDLKDLGDVHGLYGRAKLSDWITKNLRRVSPSVPPPTGSDPASTDNHPPQGGETPKQEKADATSAPAATLPKIYYSIATKEYYLQAENGTWIPVNENSVKRQLKGLGYKHGKEQEASATPLELCLNGIQLKQCVVYSAPLAGHEAGVHHINGVNVLVTQSPKLIEPVPGQFPIIDELLKRMFVNEAKDQRPYLYGWLKTHLQSFRAKKWQPHQALALCGPVDCGKSILQRIITEMFGGRSAKPHQFMSGGTNFNADLFEAEHLMVEDDAESTQHAQRKAFGAHIKAFAANRDQRCHGKYSKGLVLHPLWAVSISVNDEPQRLLVLPPIDQDTEDKIILLRVNQCKMPMPTNTLDEKDQFWGTMVKELPAFIDFLLKWEIPEDLRSAKYGIKHYHDPEILQAVDEVSNELRLLSLIDQEIAFYTGKPWKGSAHDLERELSGDNSGVQYEARKLFYFPTACGTYLANLAKKAPDRVQKLPRKGSNREWQINPIPGKEYRHPHFNQAAAGTENK